jgi:pilus assembly protein Flp/PilA
MLALQALSRAERAVAAAPPLTISCKHLAAPAEEDAGSRRTRGPLTLTREWAMRGLTKLLRCEKGANAIEYALVASLIAIALVAAMNNLGTRIDTMFTNVSNHLPSN